MGTHTSGAEFKEQVRDATNIVDVIGQYTELKRAGGHLKGICPLPGHNEKTPSFTVNESNQLFYCFGCQRGGDVFKFAEVVMGLSFRESIEYFAEKAGLEMPKNLSPQKDQNKPIKEKLDINNSARSHYMENLARLSADAPIKKYIAKRGLSQEVIEHFQLGFAQDSWDGLVRYLRLKNKNIDHAADIGLVRKKSGGNGYYDTQRNRLMFPIVSTKDEVVGFGGRILTDDKKEAKYINSSESDVFHKGRVLYGLKTAAPYIRQKSSVILVEGYMDVLALFQNGFKNAVGVLGTAFTDDHAKLLKRYTTNVYVLFDKDAAGWTATQRALPVLLRFGFAPKIVSLGDSKDPDDFLNEHGSGQFSEYLEKAPDLFSYFLTRTLQGISLTPTTKLRVLDTVKKILGEAQDDRLIKLYAKEVADRLGLPPAMVWQEIMGKQRSQADRLASMERTSRPSSATSASEKGKLRAPKAEIMLTALCLGYPDVLEDVVREGLQTQFESIELTDMVKNSHDLHGQKSAGSASLASLLSHKIEELGLFEAVMAVKTDEMAEMRQQLFRDCARKIRERFLKEKARSMLNQVKTHGDQESLEAYMSLQRDRNSLRSSKNDPESERLADEEV